MAELKNRNRTIFVSTALAKSHCLKWNLKWPITRLNSLSFSGLSLPELIPLEGGRFCKDHPLKKSCHCLTLIKYPAPSSYWMKCSNSIVQDSKTALMCNCWPKTSVLGLRQVPIGGYRANALTDTPFAKAASRFVLGSYQLTLTSKRLFVKPFSIKRPQLLPSEFQTGCCFWWNIPQPQGTVFGYQQKIRIHWFDYPLYSFHS